MLGREVRSLVARGDRTRWPEPWPGPGLTWTGTLRFEVAEATVALALEIVGLVSGEGWAIRLAAPGAGAVADTPPPVGDAPADAPLAAADALAETAALEAGAATRAVLQALDAAMPFDFGCVLRFVGGGALVTSVYPTAMAGIATGEAWARLDEAEVQVRDRGEPAIDGDIVPVRTSSTPLGRLVAFGLRSRMHIPLFARAEVAGVALLYRRNARAFSAADGWLAERTLRRLGERLRDPITPALAAGGGTPATDAATTARFDALGDLVAGVAHELNNPLTSILGYAQILDTLEGTDREHALHTIEEESQRAARIMRNLLQFARSEPGNSVAPSGVQLPLTPSQPPRTLAPTPEAHEPVTGLASAPAAAHLLVIDEDPAVRLLTSEILMGAGYDVATAPDGAQGTLLLASGDYDAVIADVGMRGLDAATLGAWILAHTRELRHRLVFVTEAGAQGRPALPPEVSALYLEKPFDREGLLSAVREVLGVAAR